MKTLFLRGKFLGVVALAALVCLGSGILLRKAGRSQPAYYAKTTLKLPNDYWHPPIEHPVDLSRKNDSSLLRTTLHEVIPMTDPALEEAALQLLGKNTRIRYAPDRRLLTIEVCASSPEQAEAIASVLARKYNEAHARDRTGQILGERRRELDKARSRMWQSYAEAANCRVEQRIVDSDPESLDSEVRTSLDPANPEALPPYLRLKAAYFQARTVLHALEEPYRAILCPPPGEPGIESLAIVEQTKAQRIFTSSPAHFPH